MATSRLPVLAAAVGVVLGAAACGSGGDPSRPAVDAQPASASSVCPPAPSDLAATLRKGMRRTGELGRVFALRSRSGFSDKDPAVRAGVYFVSGNVGAAVFTWAVNTKAWRTGAGLIVAVDRETRAASPRRWVVSPRLLEQRYGISEHTDGYAQARACANPTRR